jgi:hypothetical protein
VLDHKKEAAELFQLVELLRKDAYDIVVGFNGTVLDYATLAEKIKDAKTGADKASAKAQTTLLALRREYEDKETLP